MYLLQFYCIVNAKWQRLSIAVITIIPHELLESTFASNYIKIDLNTLMKQINTQIRR